MFHFELLNYKSVQMDPLNYWRVPLWPLSLLYRELNLTSVIFEMKIPFNTLYIYNFIIIISFTFFNISIHPLLLCFKFFCKYIFAKRKLKKKTHNIYIYIYKLVRLMKAYLEILASKKFPSIIILCECNSQRSSHATIAVYIIQVL